MTLLSENSYLFILPYPDNTDENYRRNVQEFLKADDLKGNMFLNKVYDMKDYQEYR